VTRIVGATRTRGDRPTAFVLNAGLAGLGAIRSLGRAGVPVVALDPEPSRVGFASRYCTGRRCPHPVDEPDQLLEFLIAQARGESQRPVLSPASDAWVLFLSRHRDELRDSFRFNLPSHEVVEASVDKRALYALAARVGVPHAATHYPETLDDVRDVAAAVEYPVYIKPYYSHLWHAAFPGTGKGIKASSAAQLVESFARILPTGTQAMVQEIIRGPATNVQSIRVYITQDGSLLGAFTNRKIRQYPVEFGRATMAESIHDPAFRDMGIRFFQDIDYRGFGLIEFKRDDRDGVLKVTDLNPRWLKTVNIATDSGIDFPLMHYLDLIGEEPPAQLQFEAGVRWLDAAGDFASAMSLIGIGDLSRLAWVRSWLGSRSFSSFAIDDWRPFLTEYRYGRRLVSAPVQLVRGALTRS